MGFSDLKLVVGLGERVGAVHVARAFDPLPFRVSDCWEMSRSFLVASMNLSEVASGLREICRQKYDQQNRFRGILEVS